MSMQMIIFIETERPGLMERHRAARLSVGSIPHRLGKMGWAESRVRQVQQIGHGERALVGFKSKVCFSIEGGPHPSAYQRA